MTTINPLFIRHWETAEEITRRTGHPQPVIERAARQMVAIRRVVMRHVGKDIEFKAK